MRGSLKEVSPLAPSLTTVDVGAGYLGHQHLALSCLPSPTASARITSARITVCLTKHNKYLETFDSSLNKHLKTYFFSSSHTQHWSLRSKAPHALALRSKAPHSLPLTPEVPVGYNTLPHIGSRGIRPTAVKLPKTFSIREWLVEGQQQKPLFCRCIAFVGVKTRN